LRQIHRNAPRIRIPPAIPAELNQRENAGVVEQRRRAACGCEFCRERLHVYVVDSV
jgi:hypothetical protein